MKMRKIALLCATGILQYAAGCTYTTPPYTFVLGMEDDGRTINARSYERIVIILTDTSHPGYTWEADGVDPGVAHLEQTEDVVVSQPGLAAPPRFQVLIFLAGQGTTPVNLEYRLSGAPHGSGIDTFLIWLVNDS